MSAALTACVELTALGPQGSVPSYIAAGHGCIARAVGATSGFVGVSVRLRPRRDDPLEGWRLPVFYAIGAKSREEAVAVEQELREETYVNDAVVRAVIRDSGRHRVYHDPDPRKPPGRPNTLDEKYWTMLGLVDRLKLVYEVSDRVALHFGFDRTAGAEHFTARERGLLEDVLLGLGPWARRVALIHGFLEDQQPLSPRERDIACALLGHATVKQIAAQLDISEPRARELVRAVYRKLDVGSRAELASEWSAAPATAAALPVAMTRVRRRI